MIIANLELRSSHLRQVLVKTGEAALNGKAIAAEETSKEKNILLGSFGLQDTPRSKTESRSSDRLRPVNYLEVYSCHTQKLIGSLVDITSRGLRLLCNESPEVGKTYAMQLRLPQPIKAAEEIHFEALCRWNMPSQSSLLAGTFSAGFEIVEIDPVSCDVLDAMLKSSWFRDWRQLPDYQAIRNETGYPKN